MKKKRGLFVILAGVVLLCVLSVCYFALLKANSSEEETTEEETTEEEVAAIASDDISTLTFEAGDQTVTFQKAEDSWTLEGQEDFPVDASKVDSVVSCLASVKADRTLTDVEDPGEYGLDVPTNVIEVVKTDGSSEKITVGDKNSSTGNTYICLNDDASTVYTTSTDFGSTFSGGLYNYAESESYPTITSSTIRKIVVKKDNNSYTVTNNGKSSTGWYVQEEDNKKQEADSTQVGTLQSTVAGLVLPDITTTTVRTGKHMALRSRKWPSQSIIQKKWKQNPQTTQKAILRQIRTIQKIPVKRPHRQRTKNWFCMWEMSMKPMEIIT